MTNKLNDLLTELKQFKWVDLTHEFGPDSPHFPAFSAAKFETLFTHEDGFFVKQYTFPGQYGTHIDPPVHFEKNQDVYDSDIELKDLFLPLVVIDQSHQVAQNADYILTVADIQQWESEHGTIPPDAFVALRTDWSKRWPSQEAFENQDDHGQNHYPGWSVDALKYIYEERQAVANGHETFDTDPAILQPETGFAGEYYVLSQGHYQIELLSHLDKVPATGALISISVPKAENAPGFPARVFAIVPEEV
ncbi:MULTISPECIES: cyclase family protein [Leuconostoc]|uniref:Cyclase family protein n=2 Tax=Leuconostoc kimchii TaxID=136609 RepID=D5T1S0_LEUKI|nr:MULTISPECIES: cyclase family protein [Leuconostoc]ADG40219.1 hypothetical protein LKI_03385 [Leuconostoc kimchii IMSNU 11154]AEJ31840.1 hypothetical protein LGMK_08955 [Leuconostoc sp. C2]QBR46731.1 cyclase family protein [Leuconostoc kimchii]